MDDSMTATNHSGSCAYVLILDGFFAYSPTDNTDRGFDREKAHVWLRPSDEGPKERLEWIAERAKQLKWVGAIAAVRAR